MTNDTIAYTSDYFQSVAFDTDYQALALYIVEIYDPKTLVEFGCGPGHLSRELAKLGVQVTSVDGYSQPDFAGLPVEFYPLNLNDPIAIANFFHDKHFDLAVSLEVAEHLQPESSPILVNWLTKVAPVVVFSAAVPSQGGHGHINLHSRDYWHNLFTQSNFVISDRIREKLRTHSTVAPWYRYNVLDYVHANHPQVPQLTEVIQRLIASESAAATAYYEESTKLYLLEQKTGICN
ncbi:class I SAM-dependent methyltransferase [Anabaena lutea]|uniref:Methyltransferase domain-containing protein n=1 Tax=Anabaena lutea FACHB-196 TaxID=2692881 RepID=A0ABR8FFK7_9NOST|nr:methyltransferase domain-containing protein [Anabaena lutea]MBD2568620.1 methyltransferase domain-containing protein [Anabaena lutea FACHB-196]